MNVMELMAEDLAQLIELATANMKTIPSPVFNVNGYGAKGDGVTNDTAAIQAAIDAAAVVGGSVFVPVGTYRIGKVNLKCGIRGDGTLKALANPSDKYQCLTIPAGYNGITVSGITLDGNVTSTGSGYDAYTGTMGIMVVGDDCTIQGVVAQNTFGAGIYSYSADRLKVINCRVKTCRGGFGDGIFIGGGIDCKVLYCYVEDYTRIGIVGDSADAEKTSRIDVIGNTTYNGHDASILTGGAEYNAGIWVENAKGARVIANTVRKNTHRGIVLAPTSGGNYAFEVAFNEVYDNPTGYAITDGAGCTVHVTRNSVYGTYVTGIAITPFDRVIIRDCHFDNTTISNTGNGLIMCDMTGATQPTQVEVSGCTKGTITLTGEGAEIHVYNVTNLSLSLRDMIGQWTYNMLATSMTGTFRASHCELVASASTTYQGLFGGNAGTYFDNCDITLKGSRILDATQFRADNCRIKSDSTTIRVINMINTITKAIFKSCEFDYIQVQINVTNVTAGDNYFEECIFNEYPSTGAIYGNFTNNPFNLFVKSTHFKSASAFYPITKWNFGPTKSILDSVWTPVAGAVSGFVATLSVDVNVV